MVALLDAHGIPYAVGGSLASAARGEPRSTFDADILVDLPAEKAERLLAGIKGTFYVSEEAAREAISRRSSFNLVHLPSMFKIDLFVLDPDSLLDRSQMDRRSECRLEILHGRPLFVTAAEDIILRKLDWQRKGGGPSAHQERDILGVLKTQRGNLDLAYLKTQAQAAGLASELRHVLEASGIA